MNNQKPEDPSSTMLMVVGELKGLAVQLMNAVDDIREHKTQYKEDYKSINERLSTAEKILEHLMGKAAGLAIAAAVAAAGLTWFLELHMGNLIK